MKRKYSYQAGDKTVEREYNHIPVRYIIAGTAENQLDRKPDPLSDTDLCSDAVKRSS